ncbi:MAG: prepilin-type N-terminal cleavage/methylation domain-containing protein [Planctomycetota bacterium]|nr:prepilin-type N-terminal cleavage/methylation domain-containing protein [Planctomycetota bacterium]
MNLSPRLIQARRGASRRTGAFTLVEVLIVVAIIGVAGAIVVPQMLQIGTMQIQAASRMIIADIIYAQGEACAQGATRRVVFDVANNAYTLTDGSGAALQSSWRMGNTTNTNYTVSFNQDSRFRGCTLTTATFNGSATLEFDALGAPTDGGTVDITAAGQKFRVTVSSFTGRVSVAPVTGG